MGKALVSDCLGVSAPPHFGKRYGGLASGSEPEWIDLPSSSVYGYRRVKFSRRIQRQAEINQRLRIVWVQLDSAAEVRQRFGRAIG